MSDETIKYPLVLLVNGKAHYETEHFAVGEDGIFLKESHPDMWLDLDGIDAEEHAIILGQAVQSARKALEEIQAIKSLAEVAFSGKTAAEAVAQYGTGAFVEFVEGMTSVPLPEQMEAFRRDVLAAAREVDRGLRRTPDSGLREQVIRRDRGCCRYCGSLITTTFFIDHTHPYSKGGRTTLDNLVTACRPCNAKKWAKTPEEAGMPLREVPNE